MESTKIVPTVEELKNLDLNDPAIVELVHMAQEGDAADRLLTVSQALKKYKKAVFWAMILSTSLIMEGYDLVIVRKFVSLCSLLIKTNSHCELFRY
jgi:SP family general alpha glucoside:H+ symporter-like MFS transporter